MRFVSFGVVVVVAGSLVVGAAAAREPVFSIPSLPRLVAPKPPLPNNTPWIDDTTSDGDSRAFDLQSSWLFDPGPLMNAVRRPVSNAATVASGARRSSNRTTTEQ